MNERQNKFDPVHMLADGSWWFWDETRADRHGPYPTQERASIALNYYIQVHLEGNTMFLCHSELHVDDQTFHVHTIVAAQTENEALEQLPSKHGDHYHLQPKGVLGKIGCPGTSFLQYVDLFSPEENS